jgi:hypothetical protein
MRAFSKHFAELGLSYARVFKSASVDPAKGCLTASANRLLRMHLFFEFASDFS